MVFIDVRKVLRHRNKAAYDELTRICSALGGDMAKLRLLVHTLRKLYLRDRPVSPEDCAAVQRAVPSADFDMVYHAIQQLHRTSFLRAAPFVHTLLCAIEA